MEWLWRLLRCDDDSLREERIAEYRRKMDCAKSRVERRAFYELMQDEIAQRSPRQLARMRRGREFA